MFVQYREIYLTEDGGSYSASAVHGPWRQTRCDASIHLAFGETLGYLSKIRNPKSEIRNQKSGIRNPESEIKDSPSSPPSHQYTSQISNWCGRELDRNEAMAIHQIVFDGNRQTIAESLLSYSLQKDHTASPSRQ